MKGNRDLSYSAACEAVSGTYGSYLSWYGCGLESSGTELRLHDMPRNAAKWGKKAADGISPIRKDQPPGGLWPRYSLPALQTPDR